MYTWYGRAWQGISLFFSNEFISSHGLICQGRRFVQTAHKTNNIQSIAASPVVTQYREGYVDRLNLYRMKKIHVVRKQGKDMLSIKLELAGRLRQLNRQCSESLDKTFQRIAATLKQEYEKGLKKSKVAKSVAGQSVHDVSNQSFDPSIQLLDCENKEIPLTSIGEEAWKQAAVLSLENIPYRVVYNAPAVSHVELIETPMVGMVMFPQLSFDFATPEYSRFSWYRTRKCDGEAELHSNDAEMSNVSENDTPRPDVMCDSSQWHFLNHDKYYTTTADDIGCRLRVCIRPGNDKHPAEHDRDHEDAIPVQAETRDVVKPGPSKCLFEWRPPLSDCPKDGFRVISYNILADCYAMTDFARSDLFPYCPIHAIDHDYRIQLILKELEAYRGDVVCLQEVDRFAFESHLVSSMALQNYAGVFASKHHIKEGVALFYNRSKFRLISVENKILSESLHRDEVNAHLLKSISSNDNLKRRFMQRGTCAMVAVLQSVEDADQYLVVANTHLYFHPRAAHIRLLQVAAIFNLLEAKVKEAAALTEDARVSYVFCGDFNSAPHTGLVELALTGKLPANHADWYAGGTNDYIGGDLALKHDLKLASACGTPDYTNYVAGFSACLDYIFIDSDSLSVAQVMAHPPHDQVIAHTALPSVCAPSDHIAQVADLHWIADPRSSC